MNSTFRILAFLALSVFSVSLACADTFGSISQFEIEFATIGNPGNPDDPRGNTNPAGKVDYIYRIGKYEISEAMIDAANTEGGLGLTKDTHGPNKPATNINWLEAATFVNWLNTSQGHQAAYNFDTGGNFQLWSSVEAWQKGGENLFRHRDAVYFLTSIDEWHKAAYYDPTGGVYYDYPTGSDTAPTPVASGTTPGTAVYSQFDATDYADITQAGGLSPYGTMGQGGNAYEWEETELDLVNDSVSLERGVRGGDKDSGYFSLWSWDRGWGPPSTDFRNLGFRVASVASIPEPSSLLLGVLASVGLLARRRR